MVKIDQMANNYSKRIAAESCPRRRWRGGVTPHWPASWATLPARPIGLPDCAADAPPATTGPGGSLRAGQWRTPAGGRRRKDYHEPRQIKNAYCIRRGIML